MIYLSLEVTLTGWTDYNICAGLPAVVVRHLGNLVTIRREESPLATIRADYALTARPCTPYSIQPMKLAGDMKRWASLRCWNICSASIAVRAG